MKLLKSNVKGISIVEVVSSVLLLTLLGLLISMSMMKINQNGLLLNSHEYAFDTMDNLYSIAGGMGDYNTVFIDFFNINKYYYFTEEKNVVKGNLVTWKIYFDDKYNSLSYEPGYTIDYYLFEVFFEKLTYTQYESHRVYIRGSYYDSKADKISVNFFKSPEISFRKKVYFN